MRSITFTSWPSTRSISRCWRGESSSSKITTFAPNSRTSVFNSPSLPAPMNVAGWGCCSRCVSSPCTSQARGLGQQSQFGERVLHRQNAGLTRKADTDQYGRFLRLVGQNQALVIAHDCVNAAFTCAGEIVDRCKAA